MYIHVLTVRVIVGTGIMVQVVDYGTVPAAHPQVLTDKCNGFVQCASAPCRDTLQGLFAEIGWINAERMGPCCSKNLHGALQLLP